MPSTITVSTGQPVLLSVTASGQEPLSYQWYKDGVLIEGATTSLYEIESVDDGLSYYHVVVINSCGSVQSETAVVGGVPEPFTVEFDKLGMVIVGHEGAVLAQSIEFDKLGMVIVGEIPL